MYTDVVLPNLGFGMEEGRLVAWLKAPGDPVRKGEALAEIEGDKTTVELEALVDGVLHEIVVTPDSVVPVGSVLARIRPAGAAAGPAAPAVSAAPVVELAPAADDSAQASPLARRLAQEHGIDLAAISGSGRGGKITKEDVEAAVASQSPAPARTNGKALAAPAVRRLARDHQLDLTAIRGSGQGGRVTRADVEAALTGAKAAPAAAPQTAVPSLMAPAAFTGDRQEVNLSQMRKTIARRLAQSMQETPHFYVSAELDFTTALRLLPKETGINALLLWLTVQALKDAPDMNATYEDGKLYHYRQVHLAIAVALPNGLVTPVLRGADDFSLSGIASRARDLVARAREGRMKPDEFQGGSFTVSNLGIVRQVDHFTAIINPPQVGILAFGAVKERPVVIDGGLHIRTTAFLTLSADHRVVDGMASARFIEAFDHHLQNFKG